MSKKSVLDSLRVANPCTEDWDQMTGNAKVRFCSHCAKDVNNISEMTPKEAVRLARRSNGNLCIRYKADPVTKAPIFAARLHQLTRSPIAASGVMAASLALSTAAYAQDDLRNVRDTAPQSSNTFVIDDGEITPASTTFGSIKGTIVDPQGAVITNVTVKLLNDKGEQVRLTTSDAEGAFTMTDVLAGEYTLKAEAAFGFEPSPDNRVSIYAGSETAWTTTLQLQQINVQVDVPLGEIITLTSGTEAVYAGGIGMSVSYANPLSAAVANEDLEEARALIMNGADVNFREEDKTTPLFIAVENGQIEMVELLLTFGAKINSRNSDKQTPLMQLDYDASPGLVELMVRYGAKINLSDNEGNTALIAAADNGAKVIQALIDAGADVNLINKEGSSALMLAAENDDVDGVRALLLAGAKVNLKDEDNDTALDLSSDDAVEALLKSYGAVTGSELE